jgi:hypothetical protein
MIAHHHSASVLSYVNEFSKVDASRYRSVYKVACRNDFRLPFLDYGVIAGNSDPKRIGVNRAKMRRKIELGL